MLNALNLHCTLSANHWQSSKYLCESLLVKMTTLIKTEANMTRLPTLVFNKPTRN